MSRPLPFYKMYPADADTDENYRIFTDEELGFYTRCLNHSWVNRGLPADAEDRARALKTPRRTADRLWLRVGRCFAICDDATRFLNPRQERERTEAIGKSALAAESVRQRKDRMRLTADTSTNVPTNDVRTYNERKPIVGHSYTYARSVSESVSSGEVNLKDSEMTEERMLMFAAAWDRHLQHSRFEPQDSVFQLVMSKSDMDWAKFSDRHGRYCAYWAAKGWQMYSNSLTLWGWVQAGMPEPPQESSRSPPKMHQPSDSRYYDE